MSTALDTFRILVRLSGVILIILGIIFWTGHLLGWVPVHTVVGLILAISLWALAFLGARSGVGAGMVTLVAVWALVMLVFGAVQRQLMPGSAHWVIQVLHLLIGVGAIGLGDRLGSRMSRAAYQAR